MPPKKKKKAGKKKVSDDKGASTTGSAFRASVVLPPISSVKDQALHYAVATSDVRSLARLTCHYNFSENLCSTDVNGSTPLHMAVRKGDVNMMKLILSYNKQDINKQELKIVGGYAAIHHACLEGNVDAIKLLAEAGADLNIKCNNITGETPLHICCKLNKQACAKALLDSGASADTRDNFGNNATFWANSRENFEIVKVLGLAPSKSATPQEFLALTLERNKFFVLPSAHAKAKKGKKEGGKGKKGKKK